MPRPVPPAAVAEYLVTYRSTLRRKVVAFGQAYRALGTGGGVTKRQLCGRTGLTAATVLEIYDQEG